MNCHNLAGMSDLDGDARDRACKAEPDLHVAGLRRAGLAGVGVVLAGCVVLRPDAALGWGVALASFAALWWTLPPLLRGHYRHDRFGPANTVTLIRAAMACAMLGPLIAGQPGGWTVAAIASLALALDGADGWLARRSRLCSAFGARFDVEVDAAMALILALHAWQATAAGVWVLAIAALRYVFVAAAWVWPWLSAPLPPRFSRKAVCVLELAALVVLQVPILPPVLAVALVWSTLALLLWSFAVDVIWLRARRG